MNRREFIRNVTAGALAASPAMKVAALFRDFGSPPMTATEVLLRQKQMYLYLAEKIVDPPILVPYDSYVSRAFVMQYREEVLDSYHGLKRRLA